MGIETALLAISVSGLAVQGYSAAKQYEARKDQTAASIRAENLREEQMRNENIRKQRELIRQQQNARAIALSRSVSQGAGQGEGASSSLFGAYGQVQGAYGRASNTEEQNLDIGAGLFSANRDIAKAGGEIATYEGAGKLGSILTTNALTIAKVGTQIGSGQLYSSLFGRGEWDTTTTVG